MGNHFCPYCMGPTGPDGVCANCGRAAAEYKPAPYHLPPGTVLAGRYLVGRVLGEGGFGITYVGKDLQLEVKVAIKEYYPTDKATRLAADSLGLVRYANTDALFEKGLERFLQEARALAKMSKLKEIVGVSDHFRENGTAYIAMEFVEGMTFKELTARRGGHVPAEELLGLVEPLFISLEKMHQMGFVHRDISPDNLMLEDGSVRLLDMGCAREPREEISTVTVMLKRDYAPLEQYLGRMQGPWTDVYALCATLYYCLTGQAPPPAIDRLAGDKVVPPRELGAQMSISQERALLKGMGLKPRRRFQSMEELREALYKGWEGEKPAPKERTGKKRPALWAGLAGGAVLLAVWLAFRMARGAGVPVSSLPGPTPAAVGTAAPSAAPTPTPTPGAPAVTPAPTPTASPEASSPVSSVSPISPEEGSAVEFTQGTEEDFRALLADDAVGSVVLGGDCRLLLTAGPLEIHKTVRVGPDAALALASHTTVAGGGRLEVEGRLQVELLLQFAGGGSGHIAPGGALTSEGYCWAEKAGDLIVDPEATADFKDGAHLIRLDVEETFRNAAHVTSYAEYRKICRDHSAEAIVVDADMEIPGMGESHTMPVLISEGVTVTGAIPTVGGQESSSWLVDATVLVNRGTLQADLKMNDWSGRGRPVTIINYGRTEGRSYLQGKGLMLNIGEMDNKALYSWNTDLCNVGTIRNNRLDTEGGLHIQDGVTMYNGGTCYSEGVGDAPAPIAIEQGGRLFNSGLLDFGFRGRLMNEVGSQVVSTGTVRFSADAEMMNPDVFRNAGGTVEFPLDEATGLPREDVLIGSMPEEVDYW